VVINCLRKSDQSELNKIIKLITTSCEISTNYYITAAEIKEKKNKKEIKRDGGGIRLYRKTNNRKAHLFFRSIVC
jgi:hypothetical protein